jgi:hypothetical protein
MARRRRAPKHDEQLPGRGTAPPSESKSESAGPRRADSPQAGVARLAEVAGNEAVASMLQRFQFGTDEEDETQTETPEPHEQQVEEPSRPAQLEQAGQAAQAEQAGDQDRFVIGENVDSAPADFGIQDSGPQEAERQDRAERAEGRAAALTGDAPVPTSGSVIGINADRLKAFASVRLQDADAPTRDLANGLCDAVAAAWVTWQISATIVGVRVNAVTAIGGQLVGPPLGPLIASNGARVDAEAAAALGNALGASMSAFQAGFSIQGLPLFPSFAAVPSPQAPPTPSIPMPLITAATNIGAFAGASDRIRLKDPRKQRAAAAVAGAVDNALPIWLGGAQFSLLGFGPVPTFAPPYSPVGPVVGGVANSLPGGIIG